MWVQLGFTLRVILRNFLKFPQKFSWVQYGRAYNYRPQVVQILNCSSFHTIIYLLYELCQLSANHNVQFFSLRIWGIFCALTRIPLACVQAAATRVWKWLGGPRRNWLRVKWPPFSSIFFLPAFTSLHPRMESLLTGSKTWSQYWWHVADLVNQGCGTKFLTK